MAGYHDLRSYLAYLESQGQVVHVTEPVSTKFDVARWERQHDGKRTVFFDTVEGFAMPIVANIFNRRENVAHILGVEPTVALTERLIAAARSPIPTRLVADGPVKEVMITGNDVDLVSQLPNPWHFEKDAGHYISSGVIVAKDPQTGKRNLSFARMLVHDRSTLHVMINFYRHLFELYLRAERLGRPLEVAIVLGPDPATWLEGGMPARLVPLEVDELEVAGALRGEPLEVVKCATVDLEVPASAEIVIEGEMPPGLRAPEGPYADYSLVYDTPPRQNPVIRVKAITRRAKPIYLDVLPGSRDNWLIGGVCREADLFDHLRQLVPNVRAVHLTVGSCCRFHAVVQIEKRHEYDASHVIVATLTPTEASRDVKWVTVVDKDIDPFDPEQVEWATVTRSQWDRDLIILPRMAMALDPSALARTPPSLRKLGDVLSTKAGIDATIPLEFPDRIDSYHRAEVPER